MKNKHKIREKFRSEVFKRDSYKCKVCGESNLKLDAHHIQDRNNLSNVGYIKENGITLCDTEKGCHFKAEMYHRGLEVESGYHPNDLYKLINSSYELVIKKLKDYE